MGRDSDECMGGGGGMKKKGWMESYKKGGMVIGGGDGEGDSRKVGRGIE